MKSILLIVAWLFFLITFCAASQDSRLNVCKQTVSKNFDAMQKVVGEIKNCKSTDCYSFEVCDESYREAEHELSETIRSRVTDTVTVIQSIFKELQSKYRDFNSLNNKVKELTKQQEDLQQNELQLKSEKTSIEKVVGDLSKELKVQKDELLKKRNEWKASLDLLEKEQDSKNKELKGLTDKLDVEVKDFIQFAKSIKADSEDCSKQLDQVLLYLANFASKKDAILRAEALTSRFNTLKSEAEQQLKIIANSLFKDKTQKADQLMNFMGDENLYQTFEDKIKNGEDLTISLQDGAALWDRTLNFTQTSYKKAEDYFKGKGVNIIANRLMKYTSRYLSMSSIVEGLPKLITEKHERVQREFLDKSLQVEKDIEFLENLQVVFKTKLNSLEQAILKSSGEITVLQESIKVLQISVDQLTESIEGAKIQKMKLDSEIKETLLKLQDEREIFEKTQANLQANIQSLINQVGTACSNINAKQLQEPFKQLQTLTSQVGLKVHEIDAYNTAMEQLLASSKFTEMITASENIRKIQLEVSRKISIYADLLRKIRNPGKNLIEDNTCIMMGLYGSKSEIENGTNEIKKIFKELSTMGGKGADDLIKSSDAEVKALKEKHKKGNDPEVLKSLDELDSKKD